MKLAVVGLGLIGGSAALDLKACGFATEVVGVDSSDENAKLALELKLVDRVLPLKEALIGTDLVILAIPVGAMTKVLPEILSQISDSTTVTDMGSTKSKVCESIATHPAKAQFVPSHPMAGTENSGPAAAKMNLFARKIAVICDHGSVDSVHRARVEKMYAALQMRVIFMTPTEHDVHTAYVSHLSHISSFVLANTVLEKERNVDTIFDLAGGGFESTVRLAKSSPEMWGPILEQNRENIADALGIYIRQLQEFHEALSGGDGERTKKIMEDANRIRRVLAGLGESSGETAMNDTEKRLKALRKKIDETDRKLIHELGVRQATVEKIGKLKAKSGMTAHQKSRWKEVIEARLKLGKKAKLRDVFTEAVFNLIHSESLRIQESIPEPKKKKAESQS